LLLACLCLGVFVICGCRTPPSQVAAAGISLGAAVALAAANRAVTHDCWASCDHGYVCDREAGVCVLPSELKVPTRPVADPDDLDDGCIEEEDGTRLCPDDAMPTGEQNEAKDGGVEMPDSACPPPCRVSEAATQGRAPPLTGRGRCATSRGDRSEPRLPCDLRRCPPPCDAGAVCATQDAGRDCDAEQPAP